MTDEELAKHLRNLGMHSAVVVADRIEALTAQLESTLQDRKLILEERDRTFALMLADLEAAEADAAQLREALVGMRFIVPRAMKALMDQRRDSLLLADEIHRADDKARAALKGETP